MPTTARNRTPAGKLDMLNLLIVIFHLSGPGLISRLIDCQIIIDNRIGRICNILKELSKQKAFAVFFRDCRFYRYCGNTGDWYEDSVGTALWCMEVAELITEINIAAKSAYILLQKLHFRGEQILAGLTEEDKQKLQVLAEEFAKLLKEGEKHYV
ncbi:MAG: hypothetical protein WC668_02905 [Patescibacteria group bacterium]|jgi:hypothetical protein